MLRADTAQSHWIRKFNNRLVLRVSPINPNHLNCFTYSLRGSQSSVENVPNWTGNENFHPNDTRVKAFKIICSYRNKRCLDVSCFTRHFRPAARPCRQCIRLALRTSRAAGSRASTGPNRPTARRSNRPAPCRCATRTYHIGAPARIQSNHLWTYEI